MLKAIAYFRSSAPFPYLHLMLKNLFKKRVFRYLVCGGITAIFNIVLIDGLIDLFRLNTPILRNIANVCSIEISLIFSFFVYKVWVWSGGTWKLRDVLGKQIPLYHLSAGLAVALRVLLIFPILDWVGVNHSLNTLVGILVGAVINYKFSDKFVFKTK